MPLKKLSWMHWGSFVRSLLGCEFPLDLLPHFTPGCGIRSDVVASNICVYAAEGVFGFWFEFGLWVGVCEGDGELCSSVRAWQAPLHLPCQTGVRAVCCATRSALSHHVKLKILSLMASKALSHTHSHGFLLIVLL